MPIAIASKIHMTRNLSRKERALSGGTVSSISRIREQTNSTPIYEEFNLLDDELHDHDSLRVRP